MDYKYIEQLLERYWEGETSPEEENVLRAFFAQAELPEGMARWRHLFVYEARQAALTLPEDFGLRLERLAGVADRTAAAQERPLVVRARRLPLMRRLRPLYGAVASVAVIMLVGMASRHAFQKEPNVQVWDYDPAAYQDSYDNPAEAYEMLDDGIRQLREVLKASDAAKPADTGKEHTDSIA